MAEFRTDFHRIPVEREEYRIKVDFDEDSPDLLRILSEARAQENLTGYPVVAQNNHRWLLITQAHTFPSRSVTRGRVTLELLRLEEP